MRIRAALHPEAGRAARIVARHTVDALPHQLGDVQAPIQQCQHALQIALARPHDEVVSTARIRSARSGRQSRSWRTSSPARHGRDPPAVREHAKLVLLDTLGVILAGSVQPEVAGARARLTRPAATAPPLRAGLADVGTSHGGVAQRDGWALARAVRGTPFRLRQGAVQVLPTALACADGWRGPGGRRWPR